MTAPAMVAGVMVFIAAAAALFVLAPLRRPACPRQGAPPVESGAEWERLALQRSGVIRALRDLELDRATDKLSDADYAELAACYRTQALGVLRRLDALRPGGVAADTGTAADERRAPALEQPGPGRDGAAAG